MIRLRCIAFCAIAFVATCSVAANDSLELVFPGAVGFGVQALAGRDGQVIKVVNLNDSGPGSFTEAVQTNGPRIVVFEVGGVIDLKKTIVKIAEPFLTIAGQTAPNPGVTFIRGGISIETHDVLVRHIRVRTGDAGMPKRSGWEPDGMATNGPDAWNIVVDHCSLAWAIDENLSASGNRFNGSDVTEWRRNTSHDVTFSYSIIAEGLDKASHSKGGHSKGSLIHDNATRIAVIGNLYASNVERSPFFKGGVQGVIVNNFISNPKTRAVHYTLNATEWEDRPYVTGQMVLAGNVLQHGRDTDAGLALLTMHGAGVLELYAEDNQAWNADGEPAPLCSKAKAELIHRVETRPLWPEGFQPIRAEQVRDEVLRNAGARPWDRDPVDQRIVSQARDNTGRIIDSQDEVGGYPNPSPTRRTLDVPQQNVDTWLQSFCEQPK